MKLTLKSILLVFSITAIYTSCRKEEIESIQAPEEETLVANSAIAQLMRNVTMNDGSINNIIDNANCFTIKWPAIVYANNVEVTMLDNTDLNTIEAIFDNDDQDTDVLDFIFPITLI